MPATTSRSGKIMAERLIVAERVGQESRLGALLQHFGVPLMLAVERAVFRALEELAADYDGAYWHYYELSNGGFYIAPDGGSLQIRAPGSQFCEVVSADAAGIIACLYAYGRISSARHSEVLLDHYYRLLEFARLHEEAMQILPAID
jgi:hypothetical protein